MKILILNHDEVVGLLPMKVCIALMREALIKLASGEVHQPLRTIVRPANAAGVMGLMPSYVGGDDAIMFRAALISESDGSINQTLSTYQHSILLLCDTNNSRLQGPQLPGPTI